MTDDNDDQLTKMRHTAAHVLAAASTKLKPETKLGIGPATEDGFFHDLDVETNWTENDLKKLEREMEKIKSSDLAITHREVDKDEARKLFAHDPYKLELIEEFEDDAVGVSDMGDGFFVTLCKGGHVASTSKIGHFKLTRLAGVYWRGDTSKPQLQRIYGLLFASKQELAEHQRLLEEATKRDHRKLGQQLDLFTFSPLVGPGLPLFTPRGTVIRDELESWLQSLQVPLGFERVTIPHITKAALYHTSGHWEKFQEHLFTVKGKGDETFVIKPMNCPHHTQIYASQPRSYRDLPLRYSEVTMVYRDEQAGELLGLIRVRSITQDDAHIFCRPDQIKDEVRIVMDIVQSFYKVFDFEMVVHLSIRGSGDVDKYLGDDQIWQEAETQLREVLEAVGVSCVVDEGAAAFYGPKIDFVAKDSLKREWQLATIQLDFNMPGRFDLSYIDASGKSQTPVMIHRAILGSVERFMAILLEHYAGALPLWLSPTQVAVLPISDQQLDYATGIAEQVRSAGIRVELNERGESIGKKIREAETMKVPVMLIVGKKEVEANTVAVRSRVQGDEGGQSIDKVISKLTTTIAERA